MCLKKCLLLVFLCFNYARSQSSSNFQCTSDGMFPVNSCTQYYQCVYTNTVHAYKVLYTCSTGTLFDSNIKVCNWANQVTCSGQAIVSTLAPKSITITTTLGLTSTTSTTLKTSLASKITTILTTLTTTVSKILTASSTSTTKIPLTTSTISTTKTPLTTSTTIATKTSTLPVNSLIPNFQEFTNALTKNGYLAPTLEKFTNYVNGLSAQGGITTKREAAMFLAQIMHESGGLRLLIETACGNGCVNCPNSYASSGDYAGKRYCGRGYMQLVNFYIKVFLRLTLKTRNLIL